MTSRSRKAALGRPCGRCAAPIRPGERHRRLGAGDVGRHAGDHGIAAPANDRRRAAAHGAASVNPAGASRHPPIILDVGEALVALRRALQRAAGAAGLPLHDLLDLAREFEILVGDALGRVGCTAAPRPRHRRRSCPDGARRPRRDGRRRSPPSACPSRSRCGICGGSSRPPASNAAGRGRAVPGSRRRRRRVRQDDRVIRVSSRPLAAACGVVAPPAR